MRLSLAYVRPLAILQHEEYDEIRDCARRAPSSTPLHQPRPRIEYLSECLGRSGCTFLLIMNASAPEGLHDSARGLGSVSQSESKSKISNLT